MVPSVQGGCSVPIIASDYDMFDAIRTLVRRHSYRCKLADKRPEYVSVSVPHDLIDRYWSNVDQVRLSYFEDLDCLVLTPSEAQHD